MSMRLAAAFVIAFAAVAACHDDEVAPAPKGACVPPARTATATVDLVSAAPFADTAFTAPVEIVYGPDARWYVIEQAGVVKAVPATGGDPTVVLDLSSRVKSGGEAGMLGIAFDPQYSTNGFVYLHWDEQLAGRSGVFSSVIARFTHFDPATEKKILIQDQPFANHNGGKLAFGPDNFLYIGLGDGGSEGDPNGNGQNKTVLLGKILRIDPNGADPYAIPKDNPFGNEIYAYGLRNPWKFSFDTETGDLWCADVGQNRFEEIDKIVLGGNYGWNVREASHCYPPGASCTSDGFIDPVVEYGRDEGISVSGGYVYRGTKIAALRGKFVYGDFGTGNIWALGEKIATNTGLRISTFAEGPDSELWVADYQTGKIHAIVPGAGAPPPETNTKISATGCVDNPELLSYDVAMPLWSDGAKKERALYVPAGKKIAVSADGDFDVPPGTVAVKTFSVGDKRIETRLFVRYLDGGWAGYSYEWNDDQTDATLLTDGKTKPLPGGGSWTFPSRAECFACHTAVAGFTLGLEARQLDLARFAPLVDRPVDGAAFPKLEGGRGYLHANCSICHRAGSGAGAATFDLRFDRSLSDTKACNVDPSAGNLGVDGAKILAPGDPSHSVLALRMRALDQNRMPPLATHVVDEAGVSLVEDFIRSVSACP